MKPRPCRCGHPRAVHAHHRRGTDCGTCGVQCLRYRPVRDMAWIIAAFAVAAAFLAAGAIALYAFILRGSPVFGVGALVVLAAAAARYQRHAYQLLDEHHATREQVASALRAQNAERLAVVYQHPSTVVDRMWDDALVELIADHHRRDAA